MRGSTVGVEDDLLSRIRRETARKEQARRNVREGQGKKGLVKMGAETARRE